MNPFAFRKIMSQWPTGVSIVTGRSPNDQPVGMVIGSFCSVSVEPPLVAFFVKTGSATWQEVERSGGAFCVNVLSYRQSALCHTFASGDVMRRFEGIHYTCESDGAPRLPMCCAWIEARCDKTIELGDHFMVVGRVQSMDLGEDAMPLVFSKGRFNRPEPVTGLREDHFTLWEDSLEGARSIWAM